MRMSFSNVNQQQADYVMQFSIAWLTASMFDGTDRYPSRLTNLPHLPSFLLFREYVNIFPYKVGTIKSK